MRILLTLLGCLSIINASAQKSTQHMYLGHTYTGNQKIIEESAGTIESTSKLRSIANVYYNAGQAIVLSSGFSAKKGSLFTAQIRPVSDVKMRLSIFPNPIDQQTSLKFYIPKEGRISLYVVDTKGQVVSRLIEDSFKTSGNHEVIWNAAGLIPGVYVSILKTELHEISSRAIKK